MPRKLFLVFIGLFIVAACGNENEQGVNDRNNNNVQPIHYETPEEQQNRLGGEEKSIGELGGYPQSDQDNVNEGDRNLSAKNEDRYTNERTLQISDSLAERNEIVQAQVAETDDRIIVGIITAGNEYFPDLEDFVEKEVKQIIPDKDVVVYTMDVWWDRMRNMESNPNNINGEMERHFDKFFNNN